MDFSAPLCTCVCKREKERDLENIICNEAKTAQIQHQKCPPLKEKNDKLELSKLLTFVLQRHHEENEKTNRTHSGRRYLIKKGFVFIAYKERIELYT